MREKGMKHYRGRRIAAGRKKGFWRSYGYLLVTAILVIVLFRVILQLAWVPSGSMKTTIPERSLMISLRVPYLVGDPLPQRGDVVTFWSEELDKLLVKRVIGLPGEEVSFRGGNTYIDGKKLDEPYLREQGITESAGREVFSVPEGSIFVMGDNRRDSLDSRRLNAPYIPLSRVRAKAMAVISVMPPREGDEALHWRGVRTIHK